MHIRFNAEEEIYKYDIEMLVNQFYPPREQTEEAEELILYISKEADRISAFLLEKDKLIDKRQLEIDRLLEESSDSKAVRKEIKNIMKRLTYRLLEAYTKKTLPWGILTGIRPTKLAMAELSEGHMGAAEAHSVIEAMLKKDYFVSEEKAKLAVDIALREREILKDIDYREGYSLYIGIPFCPSTCLYCSFTSYPIGMYKEKTDSYVDCLFREIELCAQKYKDKKLNTIYFGGGTPTTLSAEQLERLFTKIEESFDFSYLREYTVEAGRPDSITREKLGVIKAHGITRISVNPQTMKQETLDIIGRKHTVEQVREAFALARETGFDNINMDFIVGLPNETIEDIRNTMEEILRLKPDSITIHSLAIKRAARLNMFKDNYKEMTIENNREIMELCSAYADRLGMKPYYLYRQKNMAGNMENVGYAVDGKAGIYNILIMEEVQDIVALGAGSISKRVYPDGRIERCDNVKDVSQYIGRIGEMTERKRVLFSD